ncbi:hypothetical protein ACJZ2D_012877 [Fusarium nematophilum]
MEILGALASSIAIAQAIAAGRHMVNLIRDIPEMQNEFDDWLQEIDLISVMVSEARNISSSTLGKSLILRAAQRLQEINDILQTIVSMCSKETQSKVKKRKWMLQTTKMQQLRVKAMDAKMNLHFALTCQHPDLMRQQVRSELQQQFQAFALHLSNHFGPENGNQRVLSAKATRTSSYIHFQDRRLSSRANVQNKMPKVMSVSVPHRPKRTNHELGTAPARILPRQLQINLQQIMHHKNLQERVGNCRLQCVGLRPSRMLSSADIIWFWIEGPADTFQSALKHEEIVYFPDDTNEEGRGLLEFAIQMKSCANAQMLLDLWRNLLPAQGLSQSVAFEVNTALRYQNDLTEIEVDILQRTRSWADGADDMTQTAICQAIDQGHAIDAIQETLHDEPLAINTLNLWGRAALHIAILEDRPDVVKLLISEHADVNIRDFLGQTPLMDAAQNERLECMRLLIQADCGLNQQSNNGSTALHFAVRGGRYRAVSLLLAAGASTRERDLWGRTPLHDLVWVDDPDTIERMLPLLLINKDHLEMRDGMGRTTVMEAILQLNIPLLRCLIQEQASLSTKDSNSYNMLHFAAGRATLEMMRYLISLNLSGIDTDCMNTNGYTPWETFMWYVHAPEWALWFCWRPCRDERKAFTDLYREIRDRNLGEELGCLEESLQALGAGDITAARGHLQWMARERVGWGRGGLVLSRWYDAVVKQLEGGEVDAAVENVEDYLVDLREELRTSPWQRRSRYDPRHRGIQGGST